MTATSHDAHPRVGGYRLLAKIGEGGMGVVHLAQAEDGARVALKVLRPHVIGDDEARERLSREVASLRRVSSPRVAEVLDADPWGETPYVATRYVPGLSLHQHVREHGPVEGADLRWFAACLAEAMAAVHTVGVLHRDIKPSNVLLEGRSPVLIDFGLARLAEDPRLTHTGWLLGTPGYLAPEILYGDDATTASDVHAWAATVVFAATGRPPYGTGPAMAIMDRVRRGEHDLTGVPAEVLPLVTRGLDPDPDARPTTGHLLAYLRAGDEEDPRSSQRPSRGTDQPTMPWMLAHPGVDDDPTRRAPDEPTTVPGPAALAASPAPAAVDLPPVTRAYTVAAPVQPVDTGAAAAREPYMQPPPPTGAVPSAGRPHLLPPTRYRTSGTAKVQRGVLLGGALAGVGVGTAVAPYLTFVGLALVVLLVRTISWTGQAARERQHLRGRRRWYDAPLTVLTTPWYLLVAGGGTALLLGWAGLVTFVAALGAAVLGPPLPLLLLGCGTLLGVLTWWGPGAKRLRLPVRRAAAALTRDPWVGWTAVAGVVIVLVPLVLAFAAGELSWRPAPGPPWRDGTLLGALTDWL
ncbi:MAG TPA: serine/threonine-protein kinase [Nocardioides sp.]|nr:serine/threonine-protein kinase [Nocardioides sp.]